LLIVNSYSAFSALRRLGAAKISCDLR